MSIQLNEPIGTTSRLGVARLDATRLSGRLRSSQLTSIGTYAWVRSDGVGGSVNDGRPPGAVTGGWTTERS